MSTNGRQKKKAKNPKVQALIEAIEKNGRAKKRWFDLMVEEDDKFQKWLAENRVAEPMSTGFMKSEPLPLP